MKRTIQITLTAFTSFSFLTVKAENFKSKFSRPEINHFNNLQDTPFYSNYTAAIENAYMYSKPDSNSKTKIKFPTDVALSVTKKSGNFVFGKFSISSNRSYKGWFLLKDLNEIRFTPPKISE